MRNRVSLTLDDETVAALKAAADQRGMRPTTLAAAILDSAIRGTPATPNLTTGSTPTDPQPATPNEHAEWLELDRGSRWRAIAWTAVMDLRHDYPDLGDLIKPGWTDDRFTRDGAIALAVWRQQLDTGKRTDPRLEHQWLAALRDFKQMLGARAGHVGAPVRPQDPPAHWASAIRTPERSTPPHKR